VIWERSVLAVGLVALLSGVVGCAAIPVATAPGHTAASPGTSRPIPTASSTLPSDAGGVTVLAVPGYTYTAAPDDLKLANTGLGTPGMVTMVSRTVQDESGTDVATFVLAQYNPKLTVIADRKDPNEILDPIVQKLKDQLPGKITFTTHVLSGTPVRLAQVGTLSIAYAYKHGGQMMIVTGAAPSPLNFTRAYLVASAIG
jgi:hypothetical protein